MGNNIKPHIEHASKTGVCNLSNMELTELPEVMQKLQSNLRTLDVSNNKLTILPDYFCSFSQLKLFNGSKNRFRDLPENIGSLKKLETLNLDFNRISYIPTSLGSLSYLKTITLSGNRFENFPVELCLLKSLNLLDLSKNHLTELPNCIEKLGVVELNLNQNQLSKLNDKLADCSNLKVLRIEENCLTLESFSARLLGLSQISLLVTDGNVIDQKAFQRLEGYEKYMERYTATKKKFA